MTKESSEYFGQVAGQWDNLRTGYFSEGVREDAIKKAYLRREMIVADVGAGTGFMTAGLAPNVRQVHVVDGSAEMVEVARKNLARFSNVEYHVADGASLPFDDQSLDAAFANMYLHHTPDPLAAIREMVRTLGPGGRLVITDLDEHPYAWLKEEMADVWQGFDRGQMRAWFQEAGLVNVIVDCTGQTCCAESSNPVNADEQRREAKISVFVATGTRRIAMREAVQENYAATAAAHVVDTEDSPILATASCCAPDAAAAASKESCCSPQASGGSSCCSGNRYEEVAIKPEYSEAELAGAPKEAAEISLGCGNPTALAALKPGEVVLDIGSGGGLDSFLAAGKVGVSGRVIGVDMTPAMLERARASAQRNGIANVEFRQGYAEALPVDDGEVDVIISNCVINLTEDKGHVFREAFRVLKPGGRLEVSDIVTSGPMPLKARENATGWSECVTGALPEAEYLDLIAQAGFEKAVTRRSPSMGEAFGISVYSIIASARKPSASGLF
jgi:ubiquinone/menaquinone biosynthesis C-methylase UbiE